MNSFHSSCRGGSQPSVLLPEMGNFGASCPNGPKRSGHRKSAPRNALRLGVPLSRFNGTPPGTSSGAALRGGVPFSHVSGGAYLRVYTHAPVRAPAHTRDRDTCPASTLVRVAGVHFRVPLVYSMGLKEKKKKGRTNDL